MRRESSDLGLLLSGRVLHSACALIPSCSHPTSNGQVSVPQCHPWISNADTHSTRRIYNRVAITHSLHRKVSRENLLQ